MRIHKLSSVGTLVVSIDLELPARQWAEADRRALDAATLQLGELFEQHRISATWAVADPVQSAATERLQNFRVRQEIAVLCDQNWSGPQVSRSRFASELARRVLRARAAGLTVTTLAPRDGLPEDHLDLVLKQGLTAVRGALGGAPRALRFGLWEFPGTLRLPAESHWLISSSRGVRARRGIRRAVAQQGLFHLVVDASRFGALGRPAFRTLDRVLRYAAHQRKLQQLEILTLQDAAQRLSQTPQIAPARSVLRKAA